MLHNVNPAPIKADPEWHRYHLRAWVVCGPLTVLWLLVLFVDLPYVAMGSRFISPDHVLGKAVAVGAVVNLAYAILAKLLARTKRDSESATGMIAFAVIQVLTASVAVVELR